METLLGTICVSDVRFRHRPSYFEVLSIWHDRECGIVQRHKIDAALLMGNTQKQRKE